jgi:hypothetical protein
MTPSSASCPASGYPSLHAFGGETPKLFKTRSATQPPTNQQFWAPYPKEVLPGVTGGSSAAAIGSPRMRSGLGQSGRQSPSVRKPASTPLCSIDPRATLAGAFSVTTKGVSWYEDIVSLSQPVSQGR